MIHQGTIVERRPSRTSG